MNKLRISIGILAPISMCVYVWIVFIFIQSGNAWTSSSKPFTLAQWASIILPALAYLVELVVVIKPPPIRTLSLLSVATHGPLIFWLLTMISMLLLSLYALILAAVTISPILFMIYVYRLEERQQYQPPKPS